MWKEKSGWKEGEKDNKRGGTERKEREKAKDNEAEDVVDTFYMRESMSLLRREKKERPADKNFFLPFTFCCYALCLSLPPFSVFICKEGRTKGKTLLDPFPCSAGMSVQDKVLGSPHQLPAFLANSCILASTCSPT